MSASLMSLFQAMSGGISWGEYVEPLSALHPFYTFLYLFYVVFAIFVLINVVTAVFVEQGMQSASQDKFVLINEQKQADQKNMQGLVDLFYDLDDKGDGQISWPDFETL